MLAQYILLPLFLVEDHASHDLLLRLEAVLLGSLFNDPFLHPKRGITKVNSS